MKLNGIAFVTIGNRQGQIVVPTSVGELMDKNSHSWQENDQR